MIINRTTIIVLALILCGIEISFGQNRIEMQLNDKLEQTNDISITSNFQIVEEDYNHNSNYQKKKYNLKTPKQFNIDLNLTKWNSINSIENSTYIYIPPNPDVPRKLLLTNEAVITYFSDGMYSQLIMDFRAIDSSRYEFKLCHNHSSPNDDGYIRATLTILDEERGIAVWEEWRKKEEPITFYYVMHNLSKRIKHVKNKEGIMGNLEYSFDNQLLNEMKKNR